MIVTAFFVTVAHNEKSHRPLSDAILSRTRMAWSLTGELDFAIGGSAGRKYSGRFPAPRGSGSRQRQLIGGYRNIGLAKIVALDQQRCRFILCQRVSTAVAEIEPGAMSSTTVASKCLACDFSLTRTRDPLRLRFLFKYRDERGCVDNHPGRPFSS